MSLESRQATGASSKAKRRLADPDDDGKANAQDDPAQPKRQRVSRACDSCRSKKDKCDGTQPVCSTCASLGRPCTYKANPKKRGLPTGYIRSLELLWGLVFQKIQGSEDVMRALMRSINLPSHLATMGKEAEGSDTLLSSFKNSTVLRDIERMLVVLEQPEEERERTLQAYNDGDTPLDVDAVLASAEAHEWQIPEGLDYRETPFTGISPSRASMISSAPRPSGYRTRESGVQTLPEAAQSPPLAVSLNTGESQLISSSLLQLPSNAWPLLDIYFSYTQCWFPILEKHDILRTAYQYAEGDVSMSCTAPGSGDHAALWAVLALAALQDASANDLRPCEPQGYPNISPFQMYKTARGLIPSEIGPYEIGHVQALLVLSLIKFGQQQWTAAWMLVGHAVRIAQTLGLDRPSFMAPSRSPGQQVGRAKHVFLGCFVLETLIAEHTSQCPSLRKDDLARVGAISEDGLEEWHPWEDQTGFRPTQSSRASMQRGPLHALSTFNRLVSLVSILNDLCFYKQDPTISRSQLESLELQLQRWASALPRSYRVELQNRPVKLPSPHIFGLEMAYQSIVSTLSLQIASRESDQNLPEMPHKGKAIESSKRLLQLLHVFMETYSYSATAPTFGMILGYCLPRSVSRMPVSEVEIGLRAKIESLASNLRHLWITQDLSLSGQASVIRTQAQQQDLTPSAEIPSLQHHIMPVSTPRHLVSSTDLHPSQNDSQLPPSEPFLSTPWLRATQGIDDTGALIPTPTPSMTTVGGASEVSAQPGQLDGLRQSTTAVPSKPQNVIPEFPPSFPSGGQYSAYQDPSLNISTFVDMDGYGPARRQQPQRIAPDLDALFDELASLDGAEK